MSFANFFTTVAVFIIALASSATTQATTGTSTSTVSATVSIDVSTSIAKTDTVFACVNFDWWPTDKCDYGNCPWDQQSSILNVDLTNKILRNAVSAFGGNVHLRLGGSLGDFVIYNISDTPTAAGYCKYPEFSLPTNATRIGYEFFSGCLSQSRWDEVNQFCLDSNCGGIVFGLNALIGRKLPGPCESTVNCHSNSSANPCCTNFTGFWNPEQAEVILRYSKSRGYKIYAYELGNELVGSKGIQSHISVADYLVDWSTFKSLLQKVFGAEEQPKTVVADTTWMDDWYHEFLAALPSSLKPDIVTHHLYSMGPGNDPNLWLTALNVSVLDKVKVLGDQVQKTIQATSPDSSVWLGEGGGAYNSGGNNVTNAFNSGFWYLDQLGVLASFGHGAFCRQTLVGGFYSLLDTTTFVPNPDYYSLLLWSRLMGSTVLRASVAADTDKLRVYAHCSSAKNGAVTVLLINLSNATTVNVKHIDDGSSSGADLMAGPRVEYILSSGAESGADAHTLLASRKVKLNGKLLSLSEKYDIPLMHGQPVSAKEPLVVKPLTYGFVVFEQAGASACL